MQTAVASEIIVVDGSPNDHTELAIQEAKFNLPIQYKRVDASQRGLTRQRNVGVGMVSPDSDVLVFLDDDVIPEPSFLENLIAPFQDETVIGVDGLITNECRWLPMITNQSASKPAMKLDGYYLPLSNRERIRYYLGLFPINLQPGLIPAFGHGKSSLPPSGKCYEVEHIMGGITAYRKSLFRHISFSHHFEGYGLYEDYDFSIRASAFGKLMTNTAARLEHHHEPAGRPNTYKYGKMVVTNGWYVWRLKHPHPGVVNIFKWHCITLLLAFFRLGNSFTLHAETRRQALGDFAGRIIAWVKLLLVKTLVYK
jgi:GT2 family glycosyltransferase